MYAEKCEGKQGEQKFDPQVRDPLSDIFFNGLENVIEASM